MKQLKAKKTYNKFTHDGELLPARHHEYEVIGEISFDDGRPSTFVRMLVVATRPERAIMTARKLFGKSVSFSVEKNLSEVVK